MAWNTVGRLLWSPIRPGENWAQTLVRVAGNLLRWIIGLPVIALLLLWSWFSYSNWSNNRPYWVDEFKGVKIGMTPTDVTLAKGAPDSTSEPKQREDGSWSKGMFFGHLYIFLDGPSEEKLTVYRVCESQPSYFDEVLGISGSDSEKSVIDRLGKPDQETIDDDELGKSAFFYRYNLMLRLSKAQVDGICVGATPAATMGD
jgi:hypothetical protein